ncbi:MAG TPA: hypothetical protein DCS07_11860 [Bdellovibrionales bacterium]|nr:MAG: hypothetical protein A2Z97_03560 [Bdellovibrionales bacterium GWB1_52_6]HAR43304.1 hypothetical protein [Bdellovibrionales bacterium]
MLGITLALPKNGRADLFGGDIVVLSQILIQTIQQLYQLKQIFSTGSDTLGLLRDVNRGIRDGLRVIQIINPKFNPGLYGNLDSADQVMRAIQDLYGRIPQSGETKLQEAQDHSAAEGIAMNGTLFRFADQADEEGKRIFEHSQSVSPQGATKLTAQSVAVLIGITTQVLRTNSMMLKMMSENLALQNRRDKIQSAQFKTQYDGISGALGNLPASTALKPLSGGE